MLYFLKTIVGRICCIYEWYETGNNGSSDGKTKMVNAFQNLIKLAYPNLKMLGSIQFSEETIKSIIRNTQDDLFGTDDSTMSEAESEVLEYHTTKKKTI